MKLPKLREYGKSRTYDEVFAGYNHNLKLQSGEMYDTENLTSDYFPVLSPRSRRGTYTGNVTKATGLISKGTLCYIDGTDFVIGEKHIDMSLTDKPKQLISMGAYVIIMPDRKYVNTKKLTEEGIPSDYGTIENSVSIPKTQETIFSLCDIEGAEFDVPASNVSPDAPKNDDGTSVSNGTYWIDTSSSPHILKRYSEINSMWVTVPTVYIKIKSAGIGNGFNVYDGVTISGLDTAEQKVWETEDIINDKNIKDINGNFVIWAKGKDYIVIIGMLDFTRHLAVDFKVKRKMPDMDYIIESNNRLWGCKYGVNTEGKVVNEIYSCKLGDFKNWNCFMGLSTDSYVASCGTDGKWTGAITYLGYPTFFKENHIHKVYGNFPSNFQIQDTACRGVEDGSSKSLAMVNEVLYYKNANGICAYDGSLPRDTSSAFGEIKYKNAVGCAFNNKYYVSMQDMKDKWYLFTYDTQKGIWLKEDSTQVKDFCVSDIELYYIDSADKIKTITGSGTIDTEPVEWMAESGTIGIRLPNTKYLSSMLIRTSLDVGSSLRVYIQYDSMGQWECVSSINTTKLSSFNIPIMPHRCDHFRIRIKGKGNAKIFSIQKKIEQGSDAI